MTLTAEEILSIPKDSPERLFTFGDMKNEVRHLRSIWHPDRNTDPKANEVMNYVNTLYKKAEELIDKGLWKGAAEIIFTSKEGKVYRFKYKKVHDIDIGKMYIADTVLMFVITPDNADLYKNGIDMIAQIKYPEAKYREQFGRNLPKIKHKMEDTSIGNVLILEKTSELVLLKDLLNYLPDNKLDPKHTAWITSGLCNLSCFLELNNIAHGAISSSTVFVSPQYHSVLVLGGWWYARKDGDKLLALPHESLSVLSSKILTDKKSKMQYDRSLIRALSIESLGDRTRLGSMLLKDPNIPKEVLTWYRSNPTDTAVKDFKGWATHRDAGFGERKFIKLDVDVNKIY